MSGGGFQVVAGGDDARDDRAVRNAVLAIPAGQVDAAHPARKLWRVVDAAVHDRHRDVLAPGEVPHAAEVQCPLRPRLAGQVRSATL